MGCCVYKILVMVLTRFLITFPGSCSANQKKFDALTLTWAEFSANCFVPGNLEKSSDGTLGLRDVINCFRPQCNSTNPNQYIVKQCSYIFPNYCWCSGHDGHIASNTFQRSMPKSYCSKQLIFVYIKKCTAIVCMTNLAQIW